LRKRNTLNLKGWNPAITAKKARILTHYDYIFYTKHFAPEVLVLVNPFRRLFREFSSLANWWL